ncbi:MAG: response regulator [Frankiales bacterium]|nr:MAG: response regulator [Frankiales bacterium]
MTVTTDRAIRVLVVDDTADLRFLLRMALGSESDIDVVGEAGDGREAVEAARRHRPDVMLLDLAMPVMDGLEALPLVRAASPGTQVVILSGFEATSMAASASAAGAAAYVQKGAAPDVIIGCVRRVARPDSPLPVQRATPPPRVPDDDDEREVTRLRAAIRSTAHELRNPVAALLGAAQTLSTKSDRLPVQTRTDLLAAIDRQARVLDRLTADLLAASRAELGVLEVEPERVLLLPVLGAAAATSSSVSVDCPPELVVDVDPVRLDQMIGNLLTNAQKYGAAPIWLTATAQGDLVAVEVSDRGPGVPADFQPMLFQQYARARGTRRAGTGIGLYLVRTIAEQHGGSAWFRPHPKGGAVFGFSVPRGRDPEDAERPAPRPGAGRSMTLG